MIPESGGGGDGEDREPVGDMEDQRVKNNLAVKRSRMKSRHKMSIMVNRCGKLRKENSLLELKADALLKELTFLKEMFLAHASDKKESAISQTDLERIMSDELPGPPLLEPMVGCTVEQQEEEEEEEASEMRRSRTVWLPAVRSP